MHLLRLLCSVFPLAYHVFDAVCKFVRSHHNLHYYPREFSSSALFLRVSPFLSFPEYLLMLGEHRWRSGTYAFNAYRSPLRLHRKSTGRRRTAIGSFYCRTIRQYALRTRNANARDFFRTPFALLLPVVDSLFVVSLALRRSPSCKTRSAACTALLQLSDRSDEGKEEKSREGGKRWGN